MSILSVWGPPNSGKTTLAIDLAFALIRRGKSVCLISPEPYCELGARLGLQVRGASSLASAQKSAAPLERVSVRVNDLLFVLAVSADADAFAEDAGSENAKHLLKRAEGTFDVVLTDCPAGTDNLFSACSLLLSEAVLILSGSRSASGLWFSAYRRIIDTLSPKIIPVCLEARPSFDYAGLLKLINMTPALWIPYYPEAEETQAAKQTLYESGGRAGRAYSEALQGLCGILTEGGV